MNMSQQQRIIVLMCTFCAVMVLMMSSSNGWRIAPMGVMLIGAGGIIQWCKDTRFFRKGLRTGLKKVTAVLAVAGLAALTAAAVMCLINDKSMHVALFVLAAALWMAFAFVVEMEPKKYM